MLAIEWADIASAAMRAEAQVHSDPRAACFNSRRALELGIHWLYRNDNQLKLPYQHHLSALIHEPTFVSVIMRTLAPWQSWIAHCARAILNSARAVLNWFPRKSRWSLPIAPSQVRLRVGAASGAGFTPSTRVLVNGFE